MKTVLFFTESSDKRKVILRHKKCVHISRETRNQQEYIVIRFPNQLVKLEQLEIRAERWKSSIFQKNVTDDETEFLFYDCVTFTWVLPAFEKIGLFRVTQRQLPDKEELFTYYLDAKTPWQLSYNAFFMTLQWLIEQIKKRKKQKERQ